MYVEISPILGDKFAGHYLINHQLADIVCKEQNSKCIKPCSPYGLCYNYSTLPCSSYTSAAARFGLSLLTLDINDHSFKLGYIFRGCCL